eukprot:3129058-Rhodomonas_salina.1
MSRGNCVIMFARRVLVVVGRTGDSALALADALWTPGLAPQLASTGTFNFKLDTSCHDDDDDDDDDDDSDDDDDDDDHDHDHDPSHDEDTVVKHCRRRDGP